ncbi:MAG: ABC transporter permease [Acidobacteria bacterium]|nr:ABC transporter permease [Acidobacteriota bacterium]
MTPFVETLWKDLQYGLRQLRRSPGFTTVAILSLALGIGANTAIFQLVDAVRLRTLPVRAPEQLVYIDYAPGAARAGWHSARNSRHTSTILDEIRKSQQAFAGVFAWSPTRFNLAQGGQARYAEGLYVSGNFFEELGVGTTIGRGFRKDDDTAGCSSPAAVVSYAFWQREFGAGADVLNRTVSLDGHAFPVIGVAHPAFFGVEVGRSFDVALPLCADPLFFEDRKGRIPAKEAWWLSAMGRLKPGWSLAMAQTHLVSISPAIMQASLPPSYKPDLVKKFLQNKLMAVEGATGISGLRRQFETPLWLLLATTGLVILIACANLANLLLARASVREREIAVRLAIGASRARLIRQLLSESLLLAVGGAALGFALALVFSQALVSFLTTSDNPIFVGIGMDWRVLGFTTLLAGATCILFGLIPAIRATHIPPAAAVRAGGRGSTSGRDRFVLRRSLVVMQVALSMVLLAGALLFVRSLYKVMGADAGFRLEGMLVADLELRQFDASRRASMVREIQEKLSRRAGVLDVAQIMMPALSGSGWNNSIGPDGTVAAASGKESFFNRSGPGYFRTMGTPLLAGRDFNDQDSKGAPEVAIVNEKFAEKFFGGANPVGRTFNLEQPAGKPEKLIRIVGLVRNTKYYHVREDFLSIGFFPLAQTDGTDTSATFMVRTAGATLDAANQVKAAVAEVSPAIGMRLTLMPQRVGESLTRDKLMATLSGSFGVLAVLLATIGLYGVVAYMVARRRNEIGIRIALGADKGRVVGLVLREALLLLVVGVTAGTLLALWVGRAAESLLFGVKPHDPATLTAAVALLSVVALAASLVPAMRAAGLDPMAALRDE